MQQLPPKTIWIINQYANVPPMGQGGRHRHLARELAARGHTVSLIGASWTHYVSKTYDPQAAPQVESFEGFRFVRVPVPRYADAHDKRRILNWFLFAHWLRRVPGLLRETPDAILYSSPSLIGYLGAERLARKLGARFVFEVRDIWPLSLVELGGYSTRHPFIRFLQWIEDRAYARADRVVSNLPGAVEHMVARGMDRQKFAWIPNGFSSKELEHPDPLPGPIREAIPEDKFIVCYAGTIGLANNLSTVIDAAEGLRDHTQIAFLVAGTGSQEAALRRQAQERGLTNVTFLGSLPKTQVQSLLALVDTCFVGLRPASLFRFGVSPNKLFDYLYSGRPIIYAIDSGDYRPVEAFAAGIQIPPGNAVALKQAILTLYEMPAEKRHRLGENGRSAVMEHHEYANLAAELESVLSGKK